MVNGYLVTITILTYGHQMFCDHNYFDLWSPERRICEASILPQVGSLSDMTTPGREPASLGWSYHGPPDEPPNKEKLKLKRFFCLFWGGRQLYLHPKQMY